MDLAKFKRIQVFLLHTVHVFKLHVFILIQKAKVISKVKNVLAPHVGPTFLF